MQPTTTGRAIDTASRRPMSSQGVRLAAILDRLPQAAALPPGRMLLLTGDGGAEVALPAFPGWAVYRLPTKAGSDPAGRSRTATQRALLPFADAAFDAICVYGAIQQLVQQCGLLEKVQRMLRPGGHVIAVEPLASFNFTTFPIGGPAHLLRRQLLQAGFVGVQPLAGETGVVAFVAERPAEALRQARPAGS